MQEQTGTSLTPAHPAPRSRRHIVRFWVVAAVIAVIDQATKLAALRRLEPGVEHPLIGELITLRLLRNPGAAFSAFDGMTYVVTGLAVVIVALILRRVHRRPLGGGEALLLAAVVGGAVGNLIDRFLREPGIGRGHVIDFIDYAGFFVGNVADIAIVLAAIGLLIFYLRADDTPDQGGAEVSDERPGA